MIEGNATEPGVAPLGGGERKRANKGNERQKKMRSRAIELLGGKCIRCGTRGTPENPLEFHHKVHEPCKNSYERTKQALAHPEKFVLLCWNCHKDLHAREMKRTGRIDPDCFMDVKAARSEVAKNYLKGQGV